MALEEKILKTISGPHVAAVATTNGGNPAVRFMVLDGLDDMTLVSGTMKTSRKVEQMRKNPKMAISLWSGKEFVGPYIVIQAEAAVHEDIETKKKGPEPDARKVFYFS